MRKFVPVVIVICLSAVIATFGMSTVVIAANPDQVVTSTTTVGSTVSTVLLQSHQILNGPFTVLATTGTNLACEYWTLNFTANTGQYVSGNFTSDNPINFFLVQQGIYQSWATAGTCGNAGQAISSQLVATSYEFNATIPSSGIWVIVLVNSSNAKNADGYLLANLSAGTSAVTLPLVLTTTISSPSVTAQAPSVAGFPLASIVIGVAVGLTATLLLRQRKSSGQAKRG